MADEKLTAEITNLSKSVAAYLEDCNESLNNTDSVISKLGTPALRPGWTGGEAQKPSTEKLTPKKT